MSSRAIASILFAALLSALTGPAAAEGLIASDAAVGTWFFSNLDGKGSGSLGHQGTLTFLPNGSYVHLETGPYEVHGYSGFEVGTYSFTPQTATGGLLSFTTLLDTNGDWGANSDTLFIDINAVGAKKCFIAPPPESTSICTGAGASDGSLYTGWYRGSGYGDISVLAFFPDGHYLHGVDPAIGVMEAGTYTWDATTGALALGNVQRFGSGDEVTLSQMGATAMSLGAGGLHLQTGSGEVVFDVTPMSPIPEPSSAALLVAGGLLLGASVRRQQR